MVLTRAGASPNTDKEHRAYRKTDQFSTQCGQSVQADLPGGRNHFVAPGRRPLVHGQQGTRPFRRSLGSFHLLAWSTGSRKPRGVFVNESLLLVVGVLVYAITFWGLLVAGYVVTNSASQGARPVVRSAEIGEKAVEVPGRSGSETLVRTASGPVAGRVGKLARWGAGVKESSPERSG